MPTYRYPVMLWEDFQGHWTATAVELNNVPDAVEETPAKAIAQLKQTVSLLVKENSFFEESDFGDPEIRYVVVYVQPQYKDRKSRIIPLENKMKIRVACLCGKQERGLLICAIPFLGIMFNFYKKRDFERLVRHYVSESLNGQTPAELTRVFPPETVMLEEMVVSVPRKKEKTQFKPDIAELEAIADPLGSSIIRRQYSRAFEREKQVSELVERLEGEKSSIIIVGEPGSGKTSVLIDAARIIERKQKSRKLYKYRFWKTSANRVIAGMQYLGQWEERCEAIIDELDCINGILCLEDLVEAVRTGGKDPGSSIASFLIPYIQHREIQVVFETGKEGLLACQRLLPGLTEHFQIVNLPEFNRKNGISVLKRSAEDFQKNSKIKFEDNVPELVGNLFGRFLPYGSFPGKAVKFLNKVWENATSEKLNEITPDMVIEEFRKESGLPQVFLRDDIPLDWKDSYEWFGKNIIGQDDACRAAADVSSLFKSGLNDPQKPVAVFFFCGPTGVGKTATARAMAEYFFGHGENKDDKRLIRLDMSEYGTPGAADRLIGNPDGKPSEFISNMRRQPFSVVLFDEIEKADPEVFDMLLNVMDEGRMSDKFGRQTSFLSSIIIMTSNIGAKSKNPIGIGKNDALPSEADIMGFFRPEFYNRIDRVVQFQSLEQKTIIEITRKELKDLTSREGFLTRQVKLSFSDRLVKHLASVGFDRRFGARPLQRKIEEVIIVPLAQYFLKNPKLKNTSLKLDIDKDKNVVIKK